jgi:hypothetical protein
MKFITRRRFLGLGAAGSILGLAGCKDDVWNIFGYQIGNKALYDLSIDTIFVHTFYNRTLQTTPYRGMEVSITQEVVRQIGQKTPYHVISDKDRADSELIGSIVTMQKTVLDVTQQNTVREGELAVTVDVVWRDLRDGRILSAPRKKRNPAVAPTPTIPTAPGVANNTTIGVPTLISPPFDSQVAQPPEQSSTPKPEATRIVATGRYVPELGESNATAEQKIELSIAAQIVSMMEKRWGGNRD